MSNSKAPLVIGLGAIIAGAILLARKAKEVPPEVPPEIPPELPTLLPPGYPIDEPEYAYLKNALGEFIEKRNYYESNFLWHAYSEESINAYENYRYAEDNLEYWLADYGVYSIHIAQDKIREIYPELPGPGIIEIEWKYPVVKQIIAASGSTLYPEYASKLIVGQIYCIRVTNIGLKNYPATRIDVKGLKSELNKYATILGQYTEAVGGSLTEYIYLVVKDPVGIIETLNTYVTSGANGINFYECMER